MKVAKKVTYLCKNNTEREIKKLLLTGSKCCQQL